MTAQNPPVAAPPPANSSTNLAEGELTEKQTTDNAQLRKMPVTPATYLFAALRQRNAPELEAALKRGASPNAKDVRSTPAITLAVQSKDAAMVRMLLDAKADVNATDAQGTTPLGHAKTMGLDEITRLLEAAGAR
jgi:ankyrin repeat protein